MPVVEAPNSTFGLGVGNDCVSESVTVCERKMDIIGTVWMPV